MGVAPIAYNQTIFAGDTEVLNLTILDEGETKDVTGATLRYVVAKAPGGTPLIDIDELDPFDALDGLFQIVLLPTDTDLAPGVYYHEAELTESGGVISTALTGRLVVRASSA
jgi:hypothetical protein